MATQIDHKLVNACREFRQKFDEVVNLDSLDSSEAIAAAEKLASIAREYRDDFCRVDNEEKLKCFLREKPIAYFPVLYKLVEALNDPSVQFNDPLKKALSQTVRVLLEQTTFHCIQQNRAIYKETSKKIAAIFKEIKQTLPEDEVVCRYEISCCKALVKKLDFGEGEAKELAKKHTLPLMQGLLEGVTAINASADGGAPGACITPLVGPVMNLLKDIAQRIPTIWYRAVWALRWSSIERRIVTVEQFDKFKKSFLVNQVYKRHPKIRYFLCQILFELASNNSLTQDLRSEAFRGKEISLLNFVKKTGVFEKDRFWETRYQTVVFLETLSNEAEFRDDCHQTMIKRWRSKQEARVIKNLAGDAYQRLRSSNFIAAFPVIEDPLKGKKDEVQVKIQQIKEDIKDLEDDSGIQEQSTQQEDFSSEEIQEEKEQLLDQLSDYYDQLDTSEAAEYLKTLTIGS
jgi:hypothetical protein